MTCTASEFTVFLKRVTLLVASNKQHQLCWSGMYYYHYIYKLCSPVECEA
jgi:hypothetical protein